VSQVLVFTVVISVLFRDMNTRKNNVKVLDIIIAIYIVVALLVVVLVLIYLLVFNNTDVT
jgi:uncharacterized membrane protein